MNRRFLLSGSLTVFALLAPTASAIAAPIISISGSTSIYPLVIQLAKAYVGANKGAAKFRVAQGGSDIGIADAAAGRVSLGMSSRDAKASDPGGITFNKVARDAICIVTNPSNRLSNLSQVQVQGIFSGKVRNWNQVPGATAKGPINLVVRTAASGTQDAFQKIFLLNSRQSSSAAQKASSGLLQQAVKSNKNAIGYVSLGYVQGLNTVSYRGVACNLRNAKSGQYAGTRNFWFITRGAPTGPGKKFIDWIKSSPAAKRIILTEWVPL